jgi:anaerobic selenocysteine-containing dehydrogenase
MIDLAPEVIVEDAGRLADLMEEILDVGSGYDGLLLVGRRHLRSNNSWMHQVERLAGGDRLCTLHIHPNDAQRLGLTDGGSAGVRPSHADDRNAVKATVEVTDRVSPGTISLPHGWGHRHAGTWGSDGEPPNRGVNMNHVTPLVVDRLSATAVLAAVPVTVVALP